VDADLKNFFGLVGHDKLLTLVNQRVSDGRVLRLIDQMLKAGCIAEGKWLETGRGTPQGGVVSPILSNILLTPFDWEMRKRGYRLTRYADDWMVTCRTRVEAQRALVDAKKILAALASSKIRSATREGDLYAYPREKSIQHFKEQVRNRTRRKAPVDTQTLIADINPVIRGWGQYFCKAHVRKLFARLDRWILRRIWSHRFKRWRCRGWKQLPERCLYGEMGLVRLVYLIPSLNLRRKRILVKAGCGKTARPV
jgi:RNA-directed DNA polymerase